MTAMRPLYDERRHLEAARGEAEREQARLESQYRQLRQADADIQDLISARMLWSLAQIHLVNVTSEWHGVRDRINACRQELNASQPAGLAL